MFRTETASCFFRFSGGTVLFSPAAIVSSSLYMYVSIKKTEKSEFYISKTNFVFEKNQKTDKKSRGGFKGIDFYKTLVRFWKEEDSKAYITYFNLLYMGKILRTIKILFEVTIVVVKFSFQSRERDSVRISIWILR